VGQGEQSHLTDASVEKRLRANNPLHIALQPDDLASAYVLPASRANAGGITGVVITADAGTSLRWSQRR
jgi:hypothetical protein